MKNLLIAFLLVCGTCFHAIEPVTGRVVKYPLNVRAGAGIKYTSVAKLTKNNPVEITAVSKEWLAIKPPENTRVWVLARYIKNGKFTANVNLRSGPGTGYEPVGTGRRGTEVKIDGKANAAGWVKVHVPDNVRLYIGRPAVEADEKALAALPKFDGDGGRPLPNEDLINLEGNFISEGKDVTLSGYVYESEDKIKSITHVLYEVKGEELIPKYFLVPANGKLDKYNEKEVTVRGESYKVKNWTMPVVVVKIINLKK